MFRGTPNLQEEAIMQDKARRKFLKQSIGFGTAGMALLTRPMAAAAYSRVLGANDRIRVALVGCGGMGRGDLRDFLKVKNVECAGLCDVDESQIGKAVKEIVEPLSPAGPGIKTADFRKILDMKDLDAVIVATPDHWHALPTVMACQAGKDVYVEKPLSVSIGEGRIMVDAARKHDRVVQMGTQQRSAPHYTEAVDYVKSGKLGRVRLVRAWAYLDWKGETPVQPDGQAPAGVDYDMWLGPARKRPFNPNRFHFTFRWYWDYSGGLMTDWGAHMIDIANWAMGIKAPSSAVSIGGKFGYPNDAMETPDTQQVMWAFPGFSMIWEHALGVGRGPEAREHGVQFHGEQGVLVVDRNAWEVFPETDRIDKPGRIYKSAGVPRRSSSGDMHLLHVQNFIDCMRSRKRPNSDVEIGHNSMIACHLGNIAQRLGRQVKWDVDKEMIIGDKEAQSYVTREYRAPWKLVT
jgi:predicted dehydrogenase